MPEEMLFRKIVSVVIRDYSDICIQHSGTKLTLLQKIRMYVGAAIKRYLMEL